MKKYTLIFLCILVLPVFAAENTKTEITYADFSLNFHSEVNRSLGYIWNLETGGAIELNRLFIIRGGVSLGHSGVFDVNVFLMTGLRFPVPVPLSVNVLAVYNAWPDYSVSMYSFIPYVALSGRWIGFSLGGCMRSSFYKNAAVVYEPELVFRVYVSLINVYGINVRLAVSNFSDFFPGNTGSYGLYLESIARVTNHLSVTGSVSLFQSGSIGLTSVLFGGGINGGARFEF